jgi:NADPH:quinone reductase-like Zn-dependent oxidoreductase
MKVAFRAKYGSPKVLSIKEVDIPTPKDDEVLIKVYATTVNRSDCHLLTGKPLLMRLFTGLFKPKPSITGTDFAGQIEATGKNVTSFKAGDRVMGFGGGLIGIGSHAQYLLLPETKAIKMIVNIPDNLKYEEAAACLEGAFYASGVIMLDPKAGQKALVYGATGAIGSSYVQFLKLYGVYITAVCRGEHIELVRSLGADKVIDYEKNDFTKDDERYDFVLDAIGRISFARCKHLLKKKGIYMSSGGMENLFLIFITPLFGGKKVVFKSFKSIKEGLSFIKSLIEKGSFRPVIDRKYPIDKIAEAFTYVATGQKIGNVIITMDA